MSDAGPPEPGTLTALVTGATGGIGRAVALRLRGMGLRVVALGRNEAALAELAASCGAETIAADIRDTGAIVEKLRGLLGADGAVDVLVNNAGILSARAPFQEIDPAEIDRMVDVNLKAPMHLTRALLPGMLARRRGHLVFTGSVAGTTPYANMSVYGPTKAAIGLFCSNLRMDLQGHNIRVSEIAPGRVQTGLYAGALGAAAAQAALYDGYRPIRPEDVAEIVAMVLTLPAHVDVTHVEVFPTDQVSGGGTMVKAPA